MIRQVDDLKSEVDKLDDVLRTNSINGRVLSHCDLLELKMVIYPAHKLKENSEIIASGRTHAHFF